jgi:hypothetical protein
MQWKHERPLHFVHLQTVTPVERHNQSQRDWVGNGVRCVRGRVSRLLAVQDSFPRSATVPPRDKSHPTALRLSVCLYGTTWRQPAGHQGC